MSTTAAAILLAGGSGSRVGADRNKALLTVQGLPVLAHSVRTVASVPEVERLVVVARPGEKGMVGALVADHAGRVPWSLATGGASRHASEWSGLTALAALIEGGSIDVVAIHDSARPLAAATLWSRVIAEAAAYGGAVPAHRRTGLLGPAGPALDLLGVQTPQAFRAGPLLEAYRAADRDGFEGTDTAACIAAYTDLPVHAVDAPATNLKVTFPEDVALAERLLSP